MPALKMFKSAIATVQKAASAPEAARRSTDERKLFKSAIARVQKSASAPEPTKEGTDELLGKFLIQVRHGMPPGNFGRSNTKEEERMAAWMGA
jgi:hypothetical protein